MTEHHKEIVEKAAEKYIKSIKGMISPNEINMIKADFTEGAQEVIDNPERYDLQPINQWISIKDRLPCESGRYWCYVQEQNDLGTSHFQWNCYFANDTKEFSDQFERYNVIHWQPLPQPPINEREEG